MFSSKLVTIEFKSTPVGASLISLTLSVMYKSGELNQTDLLSLELYYKSFWIHNQVHLLFLVDYRQW